MTPAHYLVVILALLGANLPFLTSRVLFVRRPAVGRNKGFGWRLLELLLVYFLVGGVAFGLERQAHGTPYPQHWEFFATTFFLFLVFAFPGFTLRYLWRQRGE